MRTVRAMLSFNHPPRVLRASWHRVRDVLRPPPPLTISEWADQNRVLGPSSPMPGLWRTSVAPFLREIQDALSPDSGIERVIVMKPVQVGATEILLNVAGYYLVHAPSTVMIVEPNEGMVKRLSRQRIEPMIELCEPLRLLIAKARSKGGNEMALKVTRNGGVLVLASAQSAASLRSLPARVVLCDEVDAYLADVGEGAPYDLAAARATTFGSLRKVAAVSTPTDEGSLIARLYNETDQRKYFVPCPLCAAAQVLTWDNLRWEPGEPSTARYRCAVCGGEIDESHKAAMVAAGVWRATKNAADNINRVSSRVRGYHFNALISPWQRWAELVTQFEAAQESPERKKTFTNLVLAEVYSTPALEVPQADALMARAEPYPENIVPNGAAFLTCGVDVQADRVECEIVGWGRNFESWSIAYQVLYGDITEPLIWERLDELLSREWKHASGMPMQIQCTCIDAGFSPSEVTGFTRHRHGRRIFATKGLSGGWGKAIFPRRASWDKNKHAVYTISSDESKMFIANRLKIEKPGAGFMHFPMARERGWYEQLTAEKLMLIKGAKRWSNPTRARNEAFDCRALAVAALHARLLAGVDLNEWAAQFEAMIAPPPAPVIGSPPPKVNGAPTVYRSKFVYGDGA